MRARLRRVTSTIGSRVRVAKWDVHGPVWRPAPGSLALLRQMAAGARARRRPASEARGGCDAPELAGEVGWEVHREVALAGRAGEGGHRAASAPGAVGERPTKRGVAVPQIVAPPPARAGRAAPCARARRGDIPPGRRGSGDRRSLNARAPAAAARRLDGAARAGVQAVSRVLRGDGRGEERERGEQQGGEGACARGMATPIPSISGARSKIPARTVAIHGAPFPGRKCHTGAPKGRETPCGRRRIGASIQRSRAAIQSAPIH